MKYFKELTSRTSDPAKQVRLAGQPACGARARCTGLAAMQRQQWQQALAAAGTGLPNREHSLLLLHANYQPLAPLLLPSCPRRTPW